MALVRPLLILGQRGKYRNSHLGRTAEFKSREMSPY